jgi:hypothetical protein
MVARVLLKGFVVWKVAYSDIQRRCFLQTLPFLCKQALRWWKFLRRARLFLTGANDGVLRHLYVGMDESTTSYLGVLFKLALL